MTRPAGLITPLLLVLTACGTDGDGDTDATSSGASDSSTTASTTTSSTLSSSTTANATSTTTDTLTTSTAETSDDSADSSSSGGAYVRQHLLLEADFESDEPFVDFSNTQHCCDHSVTQSDAQAHGGAYSFRAEVRADDPSVSSGWRAEIVPSSVSDTGLRWYGWSIYFETPQQDGMWTGSYGGHFVQWHPDNSGGSASLAIWGSDGLWEVRTNPEGDGSADPHGELPITANEWHDVVFRVDWDLGEVTVWIDGEVYLDLEDVDYASGPGQYMKLGMNRWGNGPEGAPEDTWVIYYDDFRIGDELAQLEDVAP